MKVFTTFLFLVATSANASTFDERVIGAKAALETEQGKIYEQKLGPFIYEAIKICVPVGSSSKENLGKFALVADVSLGGKISNSIVKPETSVSNCFRENFGLQVLPSPPVSLVFEGVAPIIVEMDIVP